VIRWRILSLTHPAMRVHRKARTVLLVGGGLLALAAFYHGGKSLLETRRYPPPGKLVNIGGHRLHIHCEGAGEPTVLLDAGAGAWSIAMKRIQVALRDSIRVCSYDRAGLGWSERSGAGYDAASSIAELRTLVDSAPIRKPFVLVGHSLGANIAQVYGATHREDLAGIVLIDPATPDDLLEDFTGTDSAALAMTSCGWQCSAASAVARLGAVRIPARKAGRRNFDADDGQVYRAGLVRPSAVRATVGSMLFIPKTAVQTRRAVQFGDLPVTVLFSENTREPQGEETVADVARWHALKLTQMGELLTGTSRARGPVVVPNVTHVTVIFDSAAVRSIAAEVLRLIRTQNDAGVSDSLKVSVPSPTPKS
jgi:pimeloyl-ACP methyl ester carboxylesterase